MINKVTPFLMFNDQLEAALTFYAETFPDSKVINIIHDADGTATGGECVVGGQRFMAFNGGPSFVFSEAISMFVDCEDQAEVDAFWDAIVSAGGKPLQCGWITDPFGVSWQIVPRRFTELMADPDPKKSKAVVEAMRTMIKFDVAALEKAHSEA